MALLDAVDWTRPWFRPFGAAGAALAAALREGTDLRDALDARAGGLAGGLINAKGLPLRFVPQQELAADTAYESYIFATGRVPTRDNLHDAFNALMWFHFPKTKALLNRLQAAEIARAGVQAGRGGMRDAATLFDENAVVFLTTDAGLETALRGFAWRRLFVDDRAAWDRRCAVVPFGHALLEKLVQPYKAVTAHAWVVRHEPGMSPGDLDEALAISMTEAAARNGFQGGRSFAPLPVLGIPGWCADNAEPAFYDDTAVFRPGRRDSH